MDEAKVRTLADGRIYSGEQAHAVGLVDSLGGLQDAIDMAARARRHRRRAARQSRRAGTRAVVVATPVRASPPPGSGRSARRSACSSSTADHFRAERKEASWPSIQRDGGASMTKRDLIDEVVKQSTRVFRGRDAEVMVNAVFDSMTEALARGERIEIRGFGSFVVKHRQAREGRNPKTGDAGPGRRQARPLLQGRQGAEAARRREGRRSGRQPY